MPLSSCCDSSDGEYGPEIVINTTRSRHGSNAGGSRYHHDHRDHVYIGGELLSVPSDSGGRHRSSSTGAAPQPQVVNVVVGDRSPDRSHKSPERRHRSPERRHRSPDRHRSYDRRRGRSSESVSSEEEYRYREHHRRIAKKKSELDAETIAKLERLKTYEKEEADREYERKLKREIEIQKAKELYEAEQKAKKEKELREKWKREEAEKKEKAKREKEEEDAKFEERFKIQFMQAGYTEAQAEAVLKKKKEKERKEQNTMAVDLSRPTWIKVKRKWLLPETLDHYYLPWEWDTDSEYIVIKQYVDQDLQDKLFEHTRMLREVREVKERKMITGPIEKDVITTLKVRDRSKDQMFLVRRKSKSPGRRS